MAPQARCKLPPELGGLMRRDMEAVIHQANLGREDEKIAQLYFVDKLPQVDVATELYLGRIYCRSTETSDGDCVYFGYTLDDLDDLDDLADADCPDFSEDTLRTVRIDGRPISAYCF